MGPVSAITPCNEYNDAISKIFQKVPVVTSNDENCKNLQKNHDAVRRIYHENEEQPKVIFEPKS